MKQRKGIVIGASAWALLEEWNDVPHLLHGKRIPTLYPTRREARQYATMHFGWVSKYMKCNALMPRAVRVIVAAIVEVTA